MTVEICGATPTGIDVSCSLEAGHEGEHYATVEGCYVKWTLPPARAAYEPPAIESTAQLSPVAAAIAAASQLTPEQIEERRSIGAKREPERSAALQQWMKRSIEHANEPCAKCQHARGAHTPNCESCDCERFTDVIDAEFDG